MMTTTKGLQGGALRVKLEEAAAPAEGSPGSSVPVHQPQLAVDDRSMTIMSELFDGHVEELVAELSRMYEAMMRQGGAEGVTDGMLLEVG
jgi:hypothetical protein